MRLLGAHCLVLTALLALPVGSAQAQSQEADVSAQMHLFLQLQQLQEEVARLRGLLEEQQNALSRVQRESLERYQSLERSLSSAASAPAPAVPVEAVPPATAATAEPTSADEEKEKLYYEAAFDLIKTRDFDQAEQALSGFLHSYADSSYAANAQYWLGEVYLVKGDLEAARAAFAAVAEKWPSHSKVPDALYKQADACARLKQSAEATRLLKQVVQSYPDSSAAKLAARDLEQQKNL